MTVMNDQPGLPHPFSLCCVSWARLSLRSAEIGQRTWQADGVGEPEKGDSPIKVQVGQPPFPGSPQPHGELGLAGKKGTVPSRSKWDSPLFFYFCEYQRKPPDVVYFGWGVAPGFRRSMTLKSQSPNQAGSITS